MTGGNGLDTIVFGASKLGIGTIGYLKDRYNILYCIDNDENKWGTEISGIKIMKPGILKNYKGEIIIASVYYWEISKQLYSLGIPNEKIYISKRKKYDNDIYKYEILPLDSSLLGTIGGDLAGFDLYHEEEIVSGNKKVLIFCSYYSSYIKQLVENMCSICNDIEVSIITSDISTKDNISAKGLKHIYLYNTYMDLKTILEKLPVYDVMQLLWIEEPWAYFYNQIRKKCRRLNLNVGGSDFYRAKKSEREAKRRLIECADNVTAENQETVNAFLGYYGNGLASKMQILPFGVEVLDYIKRVTLDKWQIRQKFGINNNKIIITCGHNASTEHQHKKIIGELKKMSLNIQRQVICIFPMTYPSSNKDYISSVEKELVSLTAESLVLKDFMDFEEMAEYAVVSDIMVHVQTTDQLSSTMLEEMYAGSVVVAGSWLPYESLHKKGIFFLDISSIDNLSGILEEVIINIDRYKLKCKDNASLVYENSSWESVSGKWYNMWNI